MDELKDLGDKMCKLSDGFLPDGIAKQLVKTIDDALLKSKRIEISRVSSAQRILHAALSETNPDLDYEFRLDEAEQLLYKALNELRKESLKTKKQ